MQAHDDFVALRGSVVVLPQGMVLTIIASRQ